MKNRNKTLAAWLAFLGGPLGLHRFYLHGPRDAIGWLLPLPTLLGLYGISRVRAYGQDDLWSWVLIPFLGITIAGCALAAIVYGLMTRERWNARFNRAAPHDDAAGTTNWFTIAAIVVSLMVGTGVLMATLAFSFQRYFEYQVEEGRRISE
jgi:hypothetical protein